jgi:flagellar hook-length control protein FliK
MNETLFNPLLNFFGDAFSVLQAFPQGVVATPGGTPTTSFETLLTGLLITQGSVTPGATPGATGTPGSLLDVGAGLTGETPDFVDADLQAETVAINNRLVNFFNSTPSGVPLPSQRVSVTVTSESEAATELETVPTETFETTTPTLTVPNRLQPTSIEELATREKSRIPTTTNQTVAPPLPPTVNLVPTDGSVLATRPVTEEVRESLVEISAVAAAPTGLNNNLASPSTTLPETTPTANREVAPTAKFTLPVSTPTNFEPTTTAPVASTTNREITPTISETTAPAVSETTAPAVSTPNNAVTAPRFSVTNSTPVNVNATPAPVVRTPQPTPVKTTPSNNGIVTPTSVIATPEPTSTPIAATNNLTPTTPIANLAPASPNGFSLPGVEIRGSLPSPIPTTNSVPQFVSTPVLNGQLQPKEEIAFDEVLNPPTQNINGAESPRPNETTRVNNTPPVVATRVAEPLSEGIIREARLIETPGEAEFQIRLHPLELGEIRVQLRSTAEGLTAQLTVAHESVRQMIEGQIPELRQRLADSGVTVNGFNVSTGGSDSQRNSSNRSDYLEFLGETEATARQAPNRMAKMQTPVRSGLDVTA